MFMPIQMLPEPMGALAGTHLAREQTAATAPAGDRRIEIALLDGTCIRAGADIGLAALDWVIAAVRPWDAGPQ